MMLTGSRHMHISAYVSLHNAKWLVDEAGWRPVRHFFLWLLQGSPFHFLSRVMGSWKEIVIRFDRLDILAFDLQTWLV